MMAEMDESGDGTIDFEEFAVAMHHNYDDSLIEAASKVSPRHGRGGASEGGDSGKGAARRKHRRVPHQLARVFDRSRL